jgi:hypothetical protein
MNDNPTIRELWQAFHAWSTLHVQEATDWVAQFGDIHIDTLLAVLGIGAGAILAVLLLKHCCALTARAGAYHGRGYAWLRAVRLAQADIEDALRRRRLGVLADHPLYQRRPSGWAATPAQRQAWSQDLNDRMVPPS